MTILGADLSHFQPNPNFAQVKASGRPFVVLKASEGTSYTDPSMAARRTAAHAAGLIVGLYHFARAGDPAAEARYFLSLIGALQPGEFLVLDWEVSSANPPAWCKTWLDAVFAATGVRPFIYMNSSAMTGSNWSTVVAGNFALWLAKYDNSTAPPAVKWWPAAAMKQFSDAGNVPGIGTCDVDVFYGDEAALLRYCKDGAPSTIPQETDMRLVSVPSGTVWMVTETDVTATGDINTANALAKAWGIPITPMSDAEVQLLVADAAARRDRNGPDAYTRAGLDVLVKQICGEKATVATPFPGEANGGGWPTNPPDPAVHRYTPVMFLQALLNKSSANVDPQALADALAANDTAVGKLADALAAALAQRLQS